RLPASALLGLSTAAAAALTPIGVATVFDLAASRVFTTAARLLSLQVDPALAEARLNAVPMDAVDPPAGVPVTELADQPISILRGIAPADAAAIAGVCDVSTVSDLALWPPFLA